jgi:DNA-binding GntR family transcriptional regulator
MDDTVARKTVVAAVRVAADAQAVSEQVITERIISAVMEQRLPPGTKLSENVLCEAFGVSRARIRRVLLILAERGVIELPSNRGAFVARPSAEDARNVFGARRAIEPAITRTVAGKITRAELAMLQKQVDDETAAQIQGQRHDAIRLSGAFHVRLAEIAENPVLARIVAELVARTSLIIGLFRASKRSCSEDDHRALLSAMSSHDGDRAADLMRDHLTHIERDLALPDAAAVPVDVRAILAL